MEENSKNTKEILWKAWKRNFFCLVFVPFGIRGAFFATTKPRFAQFACPASLVETSGLLASGLRREAENTKKNADKKRLRVQIDVTDAGGEGFARS